MASDRDILFFIRALSGSDQAVLIILIPELIIFSGTVFLFLTRIRERCGGRMFGGFVVAARTDG